MQKRHKHDDIDLHDDVERIKEALAIATKDVKGRASDMINHSREKLTNVSDELQDSIATYVTEKPIKSLTIVALTGFVIGYLLRK